MGQLVYEQKSTFDIEDSYLAHLRIVVMNKLRRQESFMLQVPHREVGYVSLWMAPGVPVTFQFFGSRPPRIDRKLVDEWDAASERLRRSLPVESHLTGARAAAHVP